MRQYCKQNGIENTPEELQVALDEIRYNRNLESVEKAEQWIKSQNLTLVGVQEGVDLMLLRNKMRGSLTDEEIEVYRAAYNELRESVKPYTDQVNEVAPPVDVADFVDHIEHIIFGTLQLFWRNLPASTNLLKCNTITAAQQPVYDWRKP